MIKNQILLSILLSFNVLFSVSQDSIPIDYFRSPVDFPISLSGTFAELRGNHFHSGIDITTQKQEGKNIYACADGYVSRIKISPYGFGKALYIIHPNGFTTVYAHLSKFNTPIGAWIMSEQYRLEQFDVDLFPAKGLLAVKKGEIICYSGNSGTSEGPHLHFEIRNSSTEMPINPQLFGFEIKDFIRPIITSIMLYPEGGTSSINKLFTPYNPEIIGWGPVYRLKNSDTISIAGSFSIGLQCHDLLNGNNNRNGISCYKVYIDSLPVFDWRAETFSFPESRYINSFIDYRQFYRKGQRFMKTRIDPNNKLSMYKSSLNNGIFSPKPDSIYHVKATISDANNNESVLRFVVKGAKPVYTEKKTTSEKLNFSYLKSNIYTGDGITIIIPGNSLYNDLNFVCTASPTEPYSCSPIYNIHTPEDPLHDYIDLTITLDSVYHHQSQKMTLARLSHGKRPYSIGGQFENGFFKVKIREFGQFTVMLDTIAPTIKPINISNGKIISGQQTIRISISDDFSGIKSYRASLNGQWILMDYDAKNRLLQYNRDDRLMDGNNNFLLLVEDFCGNKNQYTAVLIN